VARAAVPNAEHLRASADPDLAFADAVESYGTGFVELAHDTEVAAVAAQHDDADPEGHVWSFGSYDPYAPAADGAR